MNPLQWLHRFNVIVLKMENQEVGKSNLCYFLEYIFIVVMIYITDALPKIICNAFHSLIVMQTVPKSYYSHFSSPSYKSYLTKQFGNYLILYLFPNSSSPFDPFRI